MDFDVHVAQDKVSSLAHRVRGCLLCEAAASVIGRSAPGVTTQDVSAVRGKVAAMLKGAPQLFDPPWEALQIFAPARNFPSRHECVTLAFDALSAAISDAETRGRPAGGDSV